MRIARETWLLMAVGLLDLASTIYLVRNGFVREANPVMAWYLIHFGELAFCTVKIIMLVCPLTILEWARRIRPVLGMWAIRVALVGYVLLYAGVVWRANEVQIHEMLSPYLSRVAPSQKKPAPPFVSRDMPNVMPVETHEAVF